MKKLFGNSAALVIFNAQKAHAGGNSYSTDLVKLTMLLGSLCALIIFLYLLDYLIRLGYGYVHHHRACRIKAVLSAEGHEFVGFVSILGLDGCRFQPLNKLVEGKLLTFLSGSTYCDYDIKIGDASHPVFVDGFHLFYAACYFYDNINRDELHDLLSHSKTKPYLVPRIGHETTRRAYRYEIARRIRKIEALKAAHGRRIGTSPSSSNSQ